MQHEQWLTLPLLAAHAGDVAAISATFQVEYPLGFLVCLQLTVCLQNYCPVVIEAQCTGTVDV